MTTANTKLTRVAPDKFEAAVGKYATAKKKAAQLADQLAKEIEKLAPLREKLTEAEEEAEQTREKIKKFVVDRKTERYTCRYGLVEKINGPFKVTDFDIDVLPVEFIKRSPEKKKILDWYKANDNTPPAGATVERGEMSVKITV